MIDIWVPGIPAPKGSTWSFISKSTGKMVTQGANPKTKGYEARVACAASEAWGGPPTNGYVGVHFYFNMPRPKSHFGTGRNVDRVKSSAPTKHTKKPDLDKLVRAVLDGLTGVVFVDDCQVTTIRSYKNYACEVGTSIEVC